MKDSSSKGPIIDTGRLGELQQDVGPEVVTQLIDMFLDGASDRQAQLRDLLGETDASASTGILHSLKSSAATLGATRLSDLAEQAERRLLTGSIAEAAELAGPLEEAFTDTIASLSEYRQRLG